MLLPAHANKACHLMWNVNGSHFNVPRWWSHSTRRIYAQAHVNVIGNGRVPTNTHTHTFSFFNFPFFCTCNFNERKFSVRLHLFASHERHFHFLVATAYNDVLFLCFFHFHQFRRASLSQCRYNHPFCVIVCCICRLLLLSISISLTLRLYIWKFE